ncbi:MAG TPA: hypothetical protein VFY92_08170 [Hyphomicrobiaceae bacterium]|nr:hypothetical protein [Hyphomicrobiaceae bacterium]
MGNQAPIAEPFFAELDQLGEEVVREQLAAGAWGKSGRRVKLAKLWLDDQERARAVAHHAEIARGSKDAANRSAAAAERSADVAAAAHAIARDANFRAALAIAIAAASLIAQLALVFLRPGSPAP